MHRALTTGTLYLSPVVLTVALGIVAFGIHAVGRGFGSSKSPAPIIIAAFIVWALHAGYLAGPWLYEHNRRGLALGLMVPIALAGIALAVLIARQLIPENTEAMNGRFVACCIGWVLALVVGYIAPIAVMLIPASSPTAEAQTPGITTAGAA